MKTTRSSNRTKSRAVSARSGAARPGYANQFTAKSPRREGRREELKTIEFSSSRLPSRLRAFAACFLAITLGTLIAGCNSPSAVNIELRKQNQVLQDRVNQLTAQNQRELDALAACQRSHPTTAALAPDRLEQLVTTHGITLGKLTGGDNPDSTKSFDSQLQVYVVPIDVDGTPIKAAGTFKVQAFDLDDPTKPLVGSWDFDLDQTRKLFYSQLMLYTYVLDCPFPKSPAHGNLTIRVTFDDALTGREFVSQVQAKVRLATGR